MSYSLIGADRLTHIKIIALALAASLLVGFAVQAAQFGDLNRKSNGGDAQSVAQAEIPTVCRFNAL